ncbi:unnamed protein product [Cuscuta epithymum]|uniref:non-specific serine/threonine protein kinase n=1 Tax=Cuscuta epithymum TaxID=186058 RepID=A0AAV0C8U2_9ASTE|nr:unnamed protein product [Cuscuta epithymum]
MSTPSPGASPSPTSPPPAPTNITSPPPAPTNITSPPPTNITSPPPSEASPPPSSPPPSVPVPSVSSPPPATPSAPPPSSSPPASPANPSTPPPSSESRPSPGPPATPPSSSGSHPPPATPSTHPPSSKSPPSHPPPPATNSRPPSRSPPSPPPPHSGSKGSNPAPKNEGSSPNPRPSPPPPDSGVSTGLVVGIAVGAVLVLLLLSLMFICCRKKRRRHHGPVDYYSPPPPGHKVDAYGGPAQQWQQYAPQPMNVDVVVPPKHYPPPSDAPWPPPSPGPSPQGPQPSHTFRPHAGSGGTSSNYSGSSNSLLPSLSPGMSLSMTKSTFTYEELVSATDGFSDANLLGQGGFGYVHKGVLTNGKEVAVKQLKVGSGQGEREFRAEVEIISRVHHKHLVSLVGYCISGSQRLLVYEFVPNNTLEFHLHGKGRPPLEWHARVKIALGAAKGLAYLHEDCQPKIIHRDIKSANILLGFNFETKVADFGLAKLTSDANTHVSTRVMGSFGYLAPEYASSGKLTEKSDVFSYGVVLLELITGRRPFDSSQAVMDDSLLDWARPVLTRALEEGNFNALVDPRLGKEYSQNEMARVVACVASCVQHSAKRRPTMNQVVRALEGQVSLSDLSEGVAPGHSMGYSSYESSEYDTAQYNDDMKKFRKMALESREYGSTGQYSNPSSEYGLNAPGSSGETHTYRKQSRGFT